MAFDYVEKIKNIVNIFEDHNTSTASPDLSASMSSRVVSIINDDPDIDGRRSDQSPVLYVTLDNATEEETQLGADFTNRKKEKTVTYEIHGCYKKEGFSKQHIDHLTDFYQMANNVEAVIKAESTLSDTALHVEVVETDFKERPTQTYWKIFKTTINMF